MISHSIGAHQTPHHLSCLDLGRAQNAGPTESAPLSAWTWAAWTWELSPGPASDCSRRNNLEPEQCGQGGYTRRERGQTQCGWGTASARQCYLFAASLPPSPQRGWTSEPKLKKKKKIIKKQRKREREKERKKITFASPVPILQLSQFQYCCHWINDANILITLCLLFYINGNLRTSLLIKRTMIAATILLWENLTLNKQIVKGIGNGNLLQHSCLENSRDTGVWQATLHVLTNSHTWLSVYTQIHTSNNYYYKMVYLKANLSLQWEF